MLKLMFVLLVGLKVGTSKNSIIISDPVIETIFLKALANRLMGYFQCLMINGDAFMGIPVLDPYNIDRIELNIPSDVVNLKIGVENISFSGISGFIVHTSSYDVVEMVLDLDMVLPLITIKAYTYEINGEIMNAIPMIGSGTARFEINELRVQGKLHFNNSDDTKLLLEKIENATFMVSAVKSGLTGIIAGEVINDSVNIVIDNAIVEYIDRFKEPITRFSVSTIINTLNRILERIDLKHFLRKIYGL